MECTSNFENWTCLTCMHRQLQHESRLLRQQQVERKLNTYSLDVVDVIGQYKVTTVEYVVISVPFGFIQNVLMCLLANIEDYQIVQKPGYVMNVME